MNWEIFFIITLTRSNIAVGMHESKKYTKRVFRYI